MIMTACLAIWKTDYEQRLYNVTQYNVAHFITRQTHTHTHTHTQSHSVAYINTIDLALVLMLGYINVRIPIFLP